MSAAISIAWNRKSASRLTGSIIHLPFHRPLDNLATFETASESGPIAPARYAIRQALDQEYQQYILRQNADARQARYKAGGGLGSVAHDDKENTELQANERNMKPTAVTRDFFGRVVDEAWPVSIESQGAGPQEAKQGEIEKGMKVWVSFHEGFSNAVRKPITLEELMRGF